MEIVYIVVKIMLWICVIGFGSNLVMQTISYSFYKGNRTRKELRFTPSKIKYSTGLTGYGYNENVEAAQVLLMFGGSNYIACNTVGMFGGYYNCPAYAVDYYGTQGSKGKMNRKSMQQSATELYDWVKEHYPNKRIILIGHSYGCGIASYLASVRECNALILLSAYRDLADLYNKILPIFYGPLKVFITNDLKVKEYAKNTNCKVVVFGSKSDKTLSASLQKKVTDCYRNAKLNIYQDIQHENYLMDERVIKQIQEIIGL